MKATSDIKLFSFFFNKTSKKKYLNLNINLLGTKTEKRNTEFSWNYIIFDKYLNLT